MKLYQYMKSPEQGETVPSIVSMSDQDILYEYWDHWEYKMIEKYGGRRELITPDNCIRDWVLIHRASEVTK